MDANNPKVRGRFAPSPTGRMHVGNLCTALLSWLSVRSAGGAWVLRIEDLDPQRSRYEYARLMEDDLHWLDLDWDEGGLDNIGPYGPYIQSQRSEIYSTALNALRNRGLTYPCHCTRAELNASAAPHSGERRPIYNGKCRPAVMPQPTNIPKEASPHSVRLYATDSDITFTDRYFGRQLFNPARDCGDFVLRRADGAWAYQLAVVADDAAMDITEVLRGCDLLSSTGQQIYLYQLLGKKAPEYGHLPLICNASGRRLSKRDLSLDMAHLRLRHTPQSLTGILAYLTDLIPTPTPIRADELIPIFKTWRVHDSHIVCPDNI